MNIQPDGKPKVSVCIPTYNGSRFLARTIDSVLNQTMGNFELLIIDNCSEDDTETIVEKYRSADPRIRYHRYASHVDMFSNFNRCFDHADGAYIKLICDDDRISPTQLEKQAAVLDARPEVSLVASAKRVIDENGSTLYESRPMARDAQMEGREAIRLSLECCRNFFGEPLAILFRKNSVARSGGFESAFGHVGDWEFACRLLGGGKLYFQSEPLCELRVHPEQFTARLRKKKAIMGHILRVYARVLARPEVYGVFSRTEKRRMLTKIISAALVETLVKRTAPISACAAAAALGIRHAPLYPLAVLGMLARAAFAQGGPESAERYDRAMKDVTLLQREQFSGAHVREHLRRMFRP